MYLPVIILHTYLRNFSIKTLQNSARNLKFGLLRISYFYPFSVTFLHFNNIPLYRSTIVGVRCIPFEVASFGSNIFDFKRSFWWFGLIFDDNFEWCKCSTAGVTEFQCPFTSIFFLRILKLMEQSEFSDPILESIFCYIATKYLS